MTYAFFQKTLLGALRISRNNTYSLTILLVLFTLLFAHEGTGSGTIRGSYNSDGINYYFPNSAVINYPPNSIAFEANNQSSQSSILAGIKNKRSAFSALTLIKIDNCTINLKIYKNANILANPIDISQDNFKLKYLLLDLPPPSNPL
jgi:spore germination protein GerM